MKYNIVSLKKENDLNKVLKNQKYSGEDLHILFLSLWDKWSVSLEEKLKNKWPSEGKRGQTVYTVDSYNMPHSFVIFNSFKVPSLVSLVRGKVMVEDYLPLIYKKFKL